MSQWINLPNLRQLFYGIPFPNFSQSHESARTCCFRRATHNAETPNGSFKCRSQNLSAPKICPSKPLKAGTLILNSDGGRNRATRMKVRTNKMGAKKVR